MVGKRKTIVVPKGIKVVRKAVSASGVTGGKRKKSGHRRKRGSSIRIR